MRHAAERHQAGLQRFTLLLEPAIPSVMHCPVKRFAAVSARVDPAEFGNIAGERHVRRNGAQGDQEGSRSGGTHRFQEFGDFRLELAAFGRERLR